MNTKAPQKPPEGVEKPTELPPAPPLPHEKSEAYVERTKAVLVRKPMNTKAPQKPPEGVEKPTELPPAPPLPHPAKHRP